jgi:hypothetical protein
MGVTWRTAAALLLILQEKASSTEAEICILLSGHWPAHHLCNPTATAKIVTSTMSFQLDANLVSAVESLISSMDEALSSIQDRMWPSVMSRVFCGP